MKIYSDLKLYYKLSVKWMIKSNIISDLKYKINENMLLSIISFLSLKFFFLFFWCKQNKYNLSYKIQKTLHYLVVFLNKIHELKVNII
jgi:hypothetical protein